MHNMHNMHTHTVVCILARVLLEESSSTGPGRLHRSRDRATSFQTSSRKGPESRVDQDSPLGTPRPNNRMYVTY